MSNYLENAWANTIRGGGNGTSFTAPAAVYVQLHTGTPGEDGTSNVSAETDRMAIEFSAASGGVLTSTTAPSWSAWDAGSETITDVSFWDASSAGNCLGTTALAASKPMTNGDTLTLAIGDVTWTLA